MTRGKGGWLTWSKKCSGWHHHEPCRDAVEHQPHSQASAQGIAKGKQGPKLLLQTLHGLCYMCPTKMCFNPGVGEKVCGFIPNI